MLKVRHAACVASRGQKRMRAASWNCRGVPLPVGPVVLVSVVIRPNEAGDEIFVAGLPNCARLNTLKHSPRISTEIRSPSATRRETAVSACHKPGPRKAFRPRLPHLPFAGTTNAAGLIHREGVPPAGGAKGTPAT